MQLISKNLKKQKGQGVMEYIIICSLVGVFCLVAVREFGNNLKTRIKVMDKKIGEISKSVK